MNAFKAFLLMCLLSTIPILMWANEAYAPTHQQQEESYQQPKAKAVETKRLPPYLGEIREACDTHLSAMGLRDSIDLCRHDLEAIAYVESEFNQFSERVNENEASYGPYQINVRAHPEVDRTQAYSWWYSSHWTLAYLISNGWPQSREYALQCHNGCNVDNGYSDKIINYRSYGTENI